MSTDLFTLLAADNALINSDLGGESVVITPTSPGSPYTISAIVMRQNAEYAFKGRAPTRGKMQISVANDATIGILASAIVAGWTATVALRPGATPIAHPILLPPLRSDPARIVFDLA